MATVLLSIRPEYVRLIFSGEKKFEFRKVRFKRDVERVILYATSPVQKIVGEAKIDYLLTGRPDEIWRETKDAAGIDYPAFREYFKGKETAVACHLVDVKRYERALSLSAFGVKKAPQSFLYLDAEK